MTPFDLAVHRYVRLLDTLEYSEGEEKGEKGFLLSSKNKLFFCILDQVANSKVFLSVCLLESKPYLIFLLLVPLEHV